MPAKNPYDVMSLSWWRFKRDAILHTAKSSGERKAEMDRLKIVLVDAMAAGDFNTFKSDCGPVAVAELLCPPKSQRKPAPSPETFETMKVSE